MRTFRKQGIRNVGSLCKIQLTIKEPSRKRTASEKIIQLNEEAIKEELGGSALQCVKYTLNVLLDAEADQLTLPSLMSEARLSCCLLCKDHIFCNEFTR